MSERARMALLAPLKKYARWLPLVPGPAAGYVWGKGYVVPTLELSSFCLAFVVVALLGAVVQSLFLEPTESHRESRRPGVFQLLWLGQYALFTLALVATLPAALLTALSGWHISLSISLPLIIVTGLIVGRRRIAPSIAMLSRVPYDSLLLAAGVSFGFFRALGLHSFHAGALGHDTLQHLYWINTVDDFGYLTLAARGSEVLENYPKVFHLLVAAWRGIGVWGPAGPYMKMMPYLQAALACGFACELWLSVKAKNAAARFSIEAPLLGAFISWHLTIGDGQEVYRVVDLSGTPRTSAGWILFGPPLMMLAQHVGTLPDMRGWLLGTLPLFCSIALGINPATLAYYLTFSLPFVLIFYLFTRSESDLQTIRWRRSFAVSSLLALPVLVTNAFLATILAGTFPVTVLLRWASVRTITRGLQMPVFSPAASAPPPLCTSPGIACTADIAGSSLLEGLGAYWQVLKSGTLPGLHPGQYTVWYFVVFAAPLLLYALKPRREPELPLANHRASSIFLAVLVSYFSVLGLMTVFNAFMLRMQNQSDAWQLFSTYYKPHHVYLGTWLQCLLVTASWSLVPTIFMSFRWFAATGAAISVLLVCQLSSSVPVDLVQHRHAGDTWNIDWPELKAIKHLDDFIPAADTVLIPSWYWQSGRENLLGTDGPEGPIVPHLTKRFLFGLTLGIGRDYNWADLFYTFCGTAADARSKLLRANSVRWVLLRHERVRERKTFDDYHWVCGITLKDLHADYPPVWSERDLALYRIHP